MTGPSGSDVTDWTTGLAVVVAAAVVVTTAAVVVSAAVDAAVVAAAVVVGASVTTTGSESVAVGCVPAGESGSTPALAAVVAPLPLAAVVPVQSG